jgi:hypothetical protein
VRLKLDYVAGQRNNAAHSIPLYSRSGRREPIGARSGSFSDLLGDDIAMAGAASV